MDCCTRPDGSSFRILSNPEVDVRLPEGRTPMAELLRVDGPAWMIVGEPKRTDVPERTAGAIPGTGMPPGPRRIVGMIPGPAKLGGAKLAPGPAMLIWPRGVGMLTATFGVATRGLITTPGETATPTVPVSILRRTSESNEKPRYGCGSGLANKAAPGSEVTERFFTTAGCSRIKSL